MAKMETGENGGDAKPGARRRARREEDIVRTGDGLGGVYSPSGAETVPVSAVAFRRTPRPSAYHRPSGGGPSSPTRREEGREFLVPARLKGNDPGRRRRRGGGRRRGPRTARESREESFSELGLSESLKEKNVFDENANCQPIARGKCKKLVSLPCLQFALCAGFGCPDQVFLTFAEPRMASREAPEATA